MRLSPPIVLLDTALGPVGPIIDFGGQEVRVMLVGETSDDFQTTQSANVNIVQAVDPAKLVYPYTDGHIAGALISPFGPFNAKTLNIRGPQSFGLFHVQAYLADPAVVAGSLKVTVYFV